MHLSNSSHSSLSRSQKFFILISLCFTLCLFASSALAADTGVVTAKVVLRKSADKDSTVLQSLPAKEEVLVLGSSGDWYKVNYGEFTGYIMKKYVKVSQNSVIANRSEIDDLGDAPAPMKIGDTGSDVKKLQQALNILHYYDGRIDGSYGTSTTAAVEAYQKAENMEADGIAGKDTIKSIFGSVGRPTDDQTAKATNNPPASPSPTQGASQKSAMTVSSIEEIGSAPSPSKEGDSGSNVKKLQQALTLLGYYSGPVDGGYGAQTTAAVKRLQEKRSMKADGVAGSSTIRILFGESTSSSSAKKTEKASSKTLKTENPDWFADEMTKVIPKNARFTIKDVRTGKTFTAARWSGANHLDAEPASAEDTKIMKDIFGGSWTWNRRAVLIKYNGHVYAASMNGMPHGTTVIGNNGFDGHFCIHFKNSKTHETQKVDPDHQKAVSTASRAAW